MKIQLITPCYACHKIKAIWVNQMDDYHGDYLPEELVCDNCLTEEENREWQ